MRASRLSLMLAPLSKPIGLVAAFALPTRKRRDCAQVHVQYMRSSGRQTVSPFCSYNSLQQRPDCMKLFLVPSSPSLSSYYCYHCIIASTAAAALGWSCRVVASFGSSGLPPPKYIHRRQQRHQQQVLAAHHRPPQGATTTEWSHGISNPCCVSVSPGCGWGRTGTARRETARSMIITMSSQNLNNNNTIDASTFSRHSSSQSTADAAETTAPLPDPLYITIGPPCAGKTTWIASQQPQNNITDVCLDNQFGVYHTLPCRYFLDETWNNNNNDVSSSQQQYEPQGTGMILGKTVAERLHAAREMELRSVLGRLAGHSTTAQQLRQALTGGAADTNHNNHSNNSNSNPYLTNELVDALVEAVEEVMATESRAGRRTLELPPTVDLFIPEALFRRYNATCPSALERCQEQLRQGASGGAAAIAWGNTNTRPSDCRVALQVASETGRPVHFVIYHDDDDDDETTPFTTTTTTTTVQSQQEDVPDRGVLATTTTTTTTTTADVPPPRSPPFLAEDVFDLSAQNLQDLLRRSVRRLLLTGRYVPATVIADMRTRTADLIRQAVQDWRQRQSSNQVVDDVDVGHRRMSKLELDQSLARLAHFEMRADRTVYAMADNSTNVGKKRPRPDHRNFAPRNDHHRRRPWERTGLRDVQDQYWDRPRDSRHQMQQQRRSNNHTTPTNTRGRGDVRHGEG